MNHEHGLGRAEEGGREVCLFSRARPESEHGCDLEAAVRNGRKGVEVAGEAVSPAAALGWEGGRMGGREGAGRRSGVQRWLGLRLANAGESGICRLLGHLRIRSIRYLYVTTYEPRRSCKIGWRCCSFDPRPAAVNSGRRRGEALYGGRHVPQPPRWSVRGCWHPWRRRSRLIEVRGWSWRYQRWRWQGLAARGRAEATATVASRCR